MSNDVPANLPEENPERKAPAEPKLPATTKSRISTAWFTAVSFMLGLLILLIFILQNLRNTSLKFLGFHWEIPLGIAMLLAAVVGGLLVALFGTARVVQLRRRLRQDKS